MRGYFAIGVEGISKPMNVGNLFRSAHQKTDLISRLFFFLEIRSNAGLQIFRLADIKNFAGGIFHPIDARLFWKFFRLHKLSEFASRPGKAGP